MNRLEYTDDHEEVLRTLIDGRLQTVWTALPGIVQSYDPERCTCVVTPAIMIQWQPDEASPSEDVRFPELNDVPVVWPGGGNYFATFPLKQGDSVLVVFAARNIDGWWAQGGIQPQPEYRGHDLSDGFALPMCFDAQRVPKFISTDSAELRSLDAEQVVRIGNDGITLKNGTSVTATLTSDAVELKAGVGAVKVQGANITVTGNLSVSGTVTAGPANVSLTTHTHQYIDSKGAAAVPTPSATQPPT